MHQRDAVAAHRLVHEVRRDEDGDVIASRQTDQQRPELVARDRIDAGGRLVEDQHVGAVDDRAGQRQPLLEPQRQVARDCTRMGDEVELVEKPVDPRGDLRAVDTEEPRVKREVLADRQAAPEREVLRHEPDAPAGLDVVRIGRLAKQPRLAFGGGQEARQHLHRGGLSAPVRAEEAEDLASLDLEADVAHGGEIAEAPGKALGDDRGFALPRRARGYLQRPLRTAFARRQERDERRLQVVRPGAHTQLVRRAGGQDAAGVHRRQPVEPLGLLHIGGRDQNAHPRPVLADVVDQIPELPP